MNTIPGILSKQGYLYVDRRISMVDLRENEINGLFRSSYEAENGQQWQLGYFWRLIMIFWKDEVAQNIDFLGDFLFKQI